MGRANTNPLSGSFFRKVKTIGNPITPIPVRTKYHFRMSNITNTLP